MVIAMVRFYDSEHGGRFTAPMTGFRPQIDVGDMLTSCSIDSLTDDTTFSFNVDYEVSLNFIFDSQYGVDHTDRLLVGSSLDIYEGSKLIGSGIVKKLNKLVT